MPRALPPRPAAPTPPVSSRALWLRESDSRNDEAEPPAIPLAVPRGRPHFVDPGAGDRVFAALNPIRRDRFFEMLVAGTGVADAIEYAIVHGECDRHGSGLLKGDLGDS